jgi:hypothetical protein
MLSRNLVNEEALATVDLHQKEKSICIFGGRTGEFSRLLVLNKTTTVYYNGHAVAQWLRHCGTNRNVAESISDGVIGIFL